jgi:hypothetical protein
VLYDFLYRFDGIAVRKMMIYANFIFIFLEK